MRITVIGGGNMGSILSVKFSQNNDVTLYLNSPYEKVEDYSKEMRIYNEDKNTYVSGKIQNITDDLHEAVNDAQWIFITYPAFLFGALADKLIPLLHEGQHLVGIPGSGGFELFFSKALEKGCTLTGLQRVHSVARVIERGRLVRESGVRSSISCASIPSAFGNEAAQFLSECYSLPVCALENYLNITMINSNPILHTSRLYSIFKDFEAEKEYDSIPLFYEEWSIASSELLVNMDRELFGMLDILASKGMKADRITTLLEHYESENAQQITDKLNSINSLKGLATPSKVNDNGKLIPDFSSRYFTADFPFGLDILCSFSDILDADCPNMKKVSDWYHRVTNTERTFTLSAFGINAADDLTKLYLN